MSIALLFPFYCFIQLDILRFVKVFRKLEWDIMSKITFCFKFCAAIFVLFFLEICRKKLYGNNNTVSIPNHKILIIWRHC